MFSTSNKSVTKKLYEYEEKVGVTIVTGEEKITLGKKVFKLFNCFLVNVPSKIDQVVVYEIMSQLTKDNVDFSVLDKISIQNLEDKN